MRVKANMALMLISVAMMAACIVVLILNQDLSTELLGATGFVGALAILITVLVLYQRDAND
jgi:hypothetical protein